LVTVQLWHQLNILEGSNTKNNVGIDEKLISAEEIPE
jgi:hypothetical protein